MIKDLNIDKKIIIKTKIQNIMMKMEDQDMKK